MYRTVAPSPSVLTPFIQTLVHASRSLRRAPGFVAIATLSLGTALGLSTSVFALIDTMTHPRSPFSNAEQLWELHVSGIAQLGLPPNALREGLAAIPGIAGVTSTDFAGDDIEANQRIEYVRYSHTPPGFFQFPGSSPAFGTVAVSRRGRRGRRRDRRGRVLEDVLRESQGNRWCATHASRPRLRDRWCPSASECADGRGRLDSTGVGHPYGFWRADCATACGGFARGCSPASHCSPAAVHTTVWPPYRQAVEHVLVQPATCAACVDGYSPSHDWCCAVRALDRLRQRRCAHAVARHGAAARLRAAPRSWRDPRRHRARRHLRNCRARCDRMCRRCRHRDVGGRPDGQRDAG